MRKTLVVAACAMMFCAASCGDGPIVAVSAGVDTEAAFDRSPVADLEAGNARFVFNQLQGNLRPFIGSANAIRGVNAAGLPWVVDRAEARLDYDGELRVRVRGLVLDPNDPVVISRGIGGTNPSATFKAILSCLTVDAAGAVATVNVSTQPAPATTGLGGGDAEIREVLSVPDPCLTPIVFVTSPTGSWFAASGF